MSDPAAWTAVGISGLALALTTTQWIESRKWRRQQEDRVNRLAREQEIGEARRAVNDIVTGWSNTMISQPMVVFDTDLDALVARARQWRDDVTPFQAQLLAHTGGTKTAAYRLVQTNVDAVMRFGREVEEIMNKHLEYEEEREAVQRSVTTMQGQANRAISDLDNLRGEELLRHA
jgi:heme exporter protein D